MEPNTDTPEIDTTGADAPPTPRRGPGRPPKFPPLPPDAPSTPAEASVTSTQVVFPLGHKSDDPNNPFRQSQEDQERLSQSRKDAEEINELRARLAAMEQEVDTLRKALEFPSYATANPDPVVQAIRSSCENTSVPGTNIMEQVITVHKSGHVVGQRRICSYGKSVLSIDAETENAKAAAAAMMAELLSVVPLYDPAKSKHHWITYTIDFPVVGEIPADA